MKHTISPTIQMKGRAPSLPSSLKTIIQSVLSPHHATKNVAQALAPAAHSDSVRSVHPQGPGDPYSPGCPGEQNPVLGGLIEREAPVRKGAGGLDQGTTAEESLP